MRRRPQVLILIFNLQEKCSSFISRSWAVVEGDEGGRIVFVKKGKLMGSQLWRKDESVLVEGAHSQQVVRMISNQFDIISLGKVSSLAVSCHCPGISAGIDHIGRCKDLFKRRRGDCDKSP